MPLTSSRRQSDRLCRYRLCRPAGTERTADRQGPLRSVGAVRATAAGKLHRGAPDGAAEASAAGKRCARLGIRPVLPGVGPDLGQNELTANFVWKSLDIPALLCYNNGALAGLAHPVERLLPKQ